MHVYVHEHVYIYVCVHVCSYNVYTCKFLRFINYTDFIQLYFLFVLRCAFCGVLYIHTMSCKF